VFLQYNPEILCLSHSQTYNVTLHDVIMIPFVHIEQPGKISADLRVSEFNFIPYAQRGLQNNVLYFFFFPNSVTHLVCLSCMFSMNFVSDSYNKLKYPSLEPCFFWPSESF